MPAIFFVINPCELTAFELFQASPPGSLVTLRLKIKGFQPDTPKKCKKSQFLGIFCRYWGDLDRGGLKTRSFCLKGRDLIHVLNCQANVI